MNLTYRKIGEKDLNFLLSLQQETERRLSSIYKGYTTREHVNNYLKRGDIYVIEDNNNPLGHIFYEKRNDHTVYLDEFVIAPEAQGKGYGSQTLKWLIDREKDAKKIELVTHPHNKRAIILYLKQGFQIENFKKNYFGDGEPRLEMIKFSDNKLLHTKSPE